MSIGGDAIIGSTYAELMPLFEADEQTEGIVIYTEPGGRMEAELARWVTENDSRLPIVAFMAGRFMDEMPGMSFGHAGTIVEGKEDTATEKIARLAEAGITVAEEISRDPRPHEGQAGREEPCLMSDDATFIGIEVDDAVAGDAELARKLQEACPVDIYAARRAAASRSSTRTSTSASSAGCASTPRRRAPSGCTSSTAARSSAPRPGAAAVHAAPPAPVGGAHAARLPRRLPRCCAVWAWSPGRAAGA